MRRLTTEEFINRSSAVHSNKYEYINSVYRNNITPISIKCPSHGDFYQRPQKHLEGSGCQKCSKYGASNISLLWIEGISKKENIFIQSAGNLGEYYPPGLPFRVDGFCKETNTIYEFYGDKFHGNLDIFNQEDRCHPFNKNLTAGELYNKTLYREQLLKEAGYNVVTIWESDFRTQYG